MIKLLDILKEIGDSSSQPYKFDFYGDYAGMRVYGFDTENYPYTVELRYEDFDLYDENTSNILSVRFYVSDEEEPDIEQDDIVTNKGELFRVMATITSIVKKDLQDNPGINTITFTPAKKEGETANVSRLNLYMRYIKHEFPNATVKPIGTRGAIEVKLK
jgi:hypothetical protein